MHKRVLGIGGIVAAVAAAISAFAMLGADAPALLPESLAHVCQNGRQPWGYADLHTHLASHLAWGSEAPGNGGVDVPINKGPIWGSPGMAFSESNPQADLGPCNPADHQLSTMPLPRTLLRGIVIGVEDSVTNLPHRSAGWPDYDGWPDSQSISHQMMHVSWLHRAWKGGLRFLVADTVDTEVLAMAWQQGFCAGARCANAQGRLTNGEVVTPIPGFDLESARRQIAFIKAFADANKDWMTVVQSPEEALQAVCSDRMAVVLGVEMDALTLEDMVQLHDAGVRHVIPIHLANSDSFGGSALYGDFFNANTKFLTGSFYRIDPLGDPTIPFRLSQQVEYVKHGPLYPLADLGLPAVLPHSKEYCALGYEDCRLDGGTRALGNGQINGEGLIDHGRPIKQLMKMGMLLDVAHMGDHGTSDALDLTEPANYPLIDSHTAVESEPSFGRNSERDLRYDLAQRLFVAGGMVGLGTGPYTNPLLVGHWIGNPVTVLSAARRQFLEALPSRHQPSGDLSKVKVQIWTSSPWPAGQPMRLLLWTASGDALAPVALSLDEAIAEEGGHTWLLSVCGPSEHGGCIEQGKARQLASFGLKTTPGAPPRTVTGIAVALVSPSEGELPLLQRFGSPLIKLTEGREWAASSFRSTEDAANKPLTRLRVKVVTGASGLPGGENDNAAIQVTLRSAEPMLAAAAVPGTHRERRHGKRRRAQTKVLHGIPTVTGGEPPVPPMILQTPFNGVLPLGPHSTSPDVEVVLPPNKTMADILSIDLVTWFTTGPLGLNTAHTWDVDRIEVAFGDGPPLDIQGGTPWIQLTQGQAQVSAYEAYEPPPSKVARGLADHFMVTVNSGSALSDKDKLEAVFKVRSCPDPVVVPLNRGLPWGGGSTHSVMVVIGCEAVPRPTLDQIEAFGLRYAGGPKSSWSLTELSLEALSDPIENWLRDYANLAQLAGDAGVTIGTDINGLAQQIAYSENPVTFPYQPGGHSEAVMEGPCVTGKRTFDVSQDGISQVGMVPDFLQAVRQLDGGIPVSEKIYRSASQAIDMWFKIQKSAAALQ